MTVKFNDKEVSFSDSGAGSAVVFIHGYMETSEVWNNFAVRVAKGFRTVCIDLPGHGQSELGSDVNTMELMAGAVKAVIDSLNIQRVLLVGHSMGGYVALAFLRLFPERLAGITLFNSHPFADPADVVEGRKKNIALVEAGGKEDMVPSFVDNLYSARSRKTMSESVAKSLSIASATDATTVIADLRGMITRTSSAALVEDGQVPLLWILGDEDSHINHVEVVKTVALPANAEVAVLSGVGHMGFVEAEEISAGVLMMFASKLPTF